VKFLIEFFSGEEARKKDLLVQGSWPDLKGNEFVCHWRAESEYDCI
jgi:hypothetical protein